MTIRVETVQEEIFNGNPNLFEKRVDKGTTVKNVLEAKIS
jgi:hypothetical protein